MAAINRMVNAATIAIQNEQVQVSSSDDEDFSDRSTDQSTNLYRQTVKQFGPHSNGIAVGRYCTVIKFRL